jgi:conjugative relaxase-like TrwC/TraI family protein
MVGITKVQRANASYWIEAVAEGGEDYYTKPGEAPGEWQGELATKLGVSGEIDKAAYAAILEGRDPNTGQELVHRPATRSFTDSQGRQRTKEPVLAFDVRFAAPKSVSLLYALGDAGVRERTIGAYDRAVAAGVRYLEGDACFVQRGKGGARIEPGSGFAAMAFRHRMSRAGDPALHTHVLVANLTQSAVDGRWLSLAAPKGRSALYQHAKAAGYVFQGQLRAELTRELGVEWTQTRNGYADVRGISRAAIEHFSQRRAEITEALAARGVSSARAAEVAAYRTRERKDYGVDPDRRREEWAARAQEFDLGRERIAELARERTPRPPRGIREADIEAALKGLESHRAHFDRRDLVCALADQLPEGAELYSLSWAADYVLGGERVISLGRPPDPSQPAYFTTPRIFELEQQFMRIAIDGRDAGVATVRAEVTEAVLARHSNLGEDQAEMVRRLTQGGERIVPVAARPGAGKTTALAAAREAFEAEGHPVIGVATARTASGELSDVGVPATSIAALLHRADDWRMRGAEPLPRGTVIVMDEASTTSTSDAARLAELVQGCDGKLVAIGDPHQIGAIGPGGLYGHLTRSIEPALLTEIRRQDREVDRRIVELAHEGRGSDALDLLNAEGRLAIADTIDEARRACVLDWYPDYSQGADAVMIARRNRDVSELNADARALLVAEGRVGAEAIQIGSRDFSVGDRVLTRLNTQEVSNRERWQVAALDRERGEVELQRLGGDARSVTLGPDYLGRQTEGGEPALQHAYAMTIYATESKTFERSYALLDAAASQEEFVVALSRAREETRAYGVASLELQEQELGPASRRAVEDEIAELRFASERSSEQGPALERELRDRIAHQDARELAARAVELRETQRAAERPPPGSRRIAEIEAQIPALERAGVQLGAEREQLESRWRPVKQELAHLLDREAQVSERLYQLQREYQRIAAEIAQHRQPEFGPRERLEQALVAGRLNDLARREVAAERFAPTRFVRETLGERPEDPGRREAWNDGVREIHAYRQRHAISDPARPLGESPRGPDARAEFFRAVQEVRRVQRRLGLGRELEMEREIGIERNFSIGR